MEPTTQQIVIKPNVGERPVVTIEGTEKILEQDRERKAAKAAAAKPEETPTEKTPDKPAAAAPPAADTQAFGELKAAFQELRAEIAGLKGEKASKAAEAQAEADLKALEAELETDAPGVIKKLAQRFEDLKQKYDTLAAKAGQMEDDHLVTKFTKAVDAHLNKALPAGMPAKVKEQVRNQVLLLAKAYPDEPMERVYQAVFEEHKDAYPQYWTADKAAANGGTGKDPGSAPKPQNDEGLEKLPPRSQGAARTKAFAQRLRDIAASRLAGK